MKGTREIGGEGRKVGDSEATICLQGQRGGDRYRGGCGGGNTFNLCFCCMWLCISQLSPVTRRQLHVYTLLVFLGLTIYTHLRESSWFLVDFIALFLRFLAGIIVI